MNQVSLPPPITDAEAARLVSPATRDALAEQIMATPRQPARPATTPARRRIRRRWLAGIPAGIAAAAAAAAVISLASPAARTPQNHPTGQGSAEPAPVQAHVLSFTRHGGYLDVVVLNPQATPAAYRAEFAAHHLDITLNFVPVSPTLVGTLVYMGTRGDATGIATITAQGRCWTGGGGYACPVGVRVPVNFHGQADITFGRTARPGEQYESTGLVTAPGEAMHGLNYRDRTVAAVLAMLRTRHVTAAQYRYAPGTDGRCDSPPPRHIPDWRVYDADPWAPHEVLLWVGPPAGTPVPHCTQPSGAGRPAPVATPTGSAS